MDRQGMIAPINPFVEADGTLTPVSFRFLWDLFHTAAPVAGTAGDQLIYLNGAWTGQRPRYPFAFNFVGGVLPANQLLGVHCFTKAVTFAANFAASEAGGTANATAETVIAVDRALAVSANAWTNIGSITFAAGGVTPTFATLGGDEVSFAIGDRMRLVAPAVPDATFANFYASLVARET